MSKNNKLYVGKEIIWSRLSAFYLPKASPFEVRITVSIVCVVSMQNNTASFQRDLNMAIAWWLDTGIYLKMEADIKSEYGSQRTSWIRPKVRGNQPLSLNHVLPSFIIFGVATFISMVAFTLEIFPYLYMQHVRRMRVRRRPRYLRRLRVAPNRSTAAPNMPRKGNYDLKKYRPRKSELGSSRTHPQ